MPKLTPKLLFLLLIGGLIAGVVGMTLITLLHFIQQTVYAISRTEGITFRIMVEQTTGMHRLLALLCCGMVAGLGWWLLHRFAAKLVNIKQAISNDPKPLPLSSTIMHGLLQIVTVGMGTLQMMNVVSYWPVLLLPVWQQYLTYHWLAHCLHWKHYS